MPEIVSTIQVVISAQREQKCKVNTYLSVNTKKSLFFNYPSFRPLPALSIHYIFRCLFCYPHFAVHTANYLGVFFRYGREPNTYLSNTLVFTLSLCNLVTERLSRQGCIEICINIFKYVYKCRY